MKRSNTVRASLVILLVCITGLGVIPEKINSAPDDWWWVVYLFYAACFRLFILFWQTLIDAVKCRSVGWVIGHFLFGPISSLAYYLVTKERPDDDWRPNPGFDHFTRGSHEVEAAEFRNLPKD